MDSHWHLSETDFFQGLAAERRAFLALASARQFKRDEFIFREGEPGGQVYYLEEGAIMIFRSSPEGKEPIISIRHAGEVFGLAEALGRRERKCNARAINEGRLWRVGADDLERLLAAHYPLARRVIEVLGRRLRYLSEQLESVMLLDVPTRLLKALFQLCYPQLVAGHDWHTPISAPLRLTQEQMASLTGSCQQTISDSLKLLQQEGWISVSGRRITLPRPLEVMKRLAL